MPQLQNLVLKDRQTTPVDHTFIPRDVRQNVGTVVESNGVPVGNSRYSVSLRQTPSGNYKAELKLAVPIVVTQTVNGVSTPVVARTSYVDAVFTFDKTSTEAERNNAVGMFADSLAPSKVLVNDLVVKLQGVY